MGHPYVARVKLIGNKRNRDKIEEYIIRTGLPPSLARVLRLERKGYCLREIAAELGVSRQVASNYKIRLRYWLETYHRIVAESGVPVGRSGYPNLTAMWLRRRILREASAAGRYQKPAAPTLRERLRTPPGKDG